MIDIAKRYFLVVSIMIMYFTMPVYAVSFPVDGDNWTENSIVGEGIDIWTFFPLGSIPEINSTDSQIGSHNIHLTSAGTTRGITFNNVDVNLSDYNTFVFWIKLNKSTPQWREKYSVYLDITGANHWNLSGNVVDSPNVWKKYVLNRTDMENGNFNSVIQLYFDWGDDQSPIEAWIDAVHFEKILESYNDSARNNIDDYFTSYEHSVYMLGNGLEPDYTYKVVFFDGDNNNTEIVINNSDPSGNLSADYTFKSGKDIPGTWHAQVFNATGGPSGTYTYTFNGPGVVAEDSFQVYESAIPEFPAGMAIPLAASLIIFSYLRNRINNGKK
jgi:hypothetical protein